MNLMETLVDVLPTPPGQSPFHVRGVFYDQVLKHVEELPGGKAAFFAQLKDPRVADFARQRFRWMDWYDALPMVPFQAAASRMEGGDFEALVRKRSRASAEALVPRMFRVVLGLGSPKAAAEHLPRLLSAHWDFVDMRMDVKDNMGSALCRSIPRLVAPSMVNTYMGLVEGALHLMGATNVEGSYKDVVPGEPLHGFETITCRVIFRWVK